MSDTTRLATALEGRYRIERELGAGGMATVYLAKDLKHDREVALKVLRPELGAVLGADRFLAEIKITARLDHPHILTLIDSGASEGFLYYVLPFVRGESLRDLLNREKQLGVDQALQITKQVASALDYAHRQGVVHRDIKPENILIQEGEAMLADFGIALAVKEAGGNRLTETGLSLGTPQYMSPEQATGDRQLDARSDVYSLGAVLYEMLAGEPPVTGPTAQAMIAKLMTERPTRLRIVRDTVSEGIDAAVARALSKIPADRFASAGDFARALEVSAQAPAGRPARPRRPALVAAVIVGVAAIAALGLLLATGRLGRRGPSVSLRERTQLTFSGGALSGAVSPDGKQLAFITRSCTETACSYAVEVQDVGGTATRRILEHATAAYVILWSPDRRNLLIWATINGHYGAYLVSALGGPPRYLTSGVVGFFAGGDSLLIGPPFGSTDSVFTVRVTSLDGAPGDSFRVRGGTALAGIGAVPGSRWIIVGLNQAGRALWQVLDRSGKVADHVLNSCACAVMASSDALWLTGTTQSGQAPIVRIALDPATGHLAASQDTVYSGNATAASVLADGSALVLFEGTLEFSEWALDLTDALRGRFPEIRRVLRSSTPASAIVSPDGNRLLVRRTLPSSTGKSQDRLSILPFAGGAESPIAGQGPPLGAFWHDSVTIAVSTQTSRGTRLALVDIRTGAQHQVLDLPDSIITDFDALPDGWVWIPAAGDRLIVLQGAVRREVAKPAWFGTYFNVHSSADGRRAALTGWNAGSFDTIGVAVVPLAGGTPETWVTRFGENGAARFAADGSLQLQVFGTQESISLYRVTAPGRAVLLGTVPRPVNGLSVSADARRAAVLVRDYHGDAWMSRVVRP
ncbi:MAG: protein kinase [Gemmatimonadales bacterium]